MNNKNLGKRLQVLEEMGFDTSKYNVEIKGNTIEITGIAHKVVEDRQVDNKKLFRRWIMAQTFRMLYERSYNCKTRQHEIGWDNYLRNKYDYKYQFDMMLEEFRVLNKLAAKDKEDFEERAHFFNKEVAVATCEHYLFQLNKYVEDNKRMDKGVYKIKLAKYGTLNMAEYRLISEQLKYIIEEMKYAENYAELYTYFKKFVNKMNKLPYDTPKCSTWKTAFKGNVAYYSLKNMILFHGCLLRDCKTKQESLALLTDCLERYKGEYWRFHYMLLDTIKFNNFDFAESIKKNS